MYVNTEYLVTLSPSLAYYSLTLLTYWIMVSRWKATFCFSRSDYQTLMYAQVALSQLDMKAWLAIYNYKERSC